MSDNSIELFDYVVGEVSDIAQNYFHPFIKCISMNKDCLTFIHSSACGNILNRLLLVWGGRQFICKSVPFK